MSLIPPYLPELRKCRNRHQGRRGRRDTTRPNNTDIQTTHTEPIGELRMIPETNGTVAIFKNTDGTHKACPVIAWDDSEWSALIMAEEGHLTVAKREPGFVRLDSGEDSVEPIALIPGGGWMAKFSIHDSTNPGGESPVVAWALRRDGGVYPLAEVGGEALSIDGRAIFDVYHPGSNWRAAQ